jgi:hypothetical protein
VKNRLLIASAFAFGLATFAVAKPMRATSFRTMDAVVTPAPACDPSSDLCTDYEPIPRCNPSSTTTCTSLKK